MNNYSIIFRARRIGSLGVASTWIRIIEADTQELAVEQLYDEFEHIHVDNVCVLEPLC